MQGEEEAAVALSEREQKLLEQMEQALYAEDPRFASRLRSASLGSSRRRLLIASLGLVAGLGLVILAVLEQVVWLGAVGFVVMVAGGAFAFAPTRKDGPSGTVGADGTVQRAKGAKVKGQAGFMQRLEERWERRSRDEW